MLTKLKCNPCTLHCFYLMCAQLGKRRNERGRRLLQLSSQASMAASACHGIFPTEITEASTAAQRVRPTKLGLRHHQVLWDILSTEYIDVNKHAMICSSLSSSNIVQVFSLPSDWVPLPRKPLVAVQNAILQVFFLFFFVKKSLSAF